MDIINQMTFREVNALLNGKDAMLFSEEGKKYIQVFINSKIDNIKSSIETFKRIVRDNPDEPYVTAYTERIKKLERMLNQ